jgi:hypothetical protein
MEPPLANLRTNRDSSKFRGAESPRPAPNGGPRVQAAEELGPIVHSYLT